MRAHVARESPYSDAPSEAVSEQDLGAVPPETLRTVRAAGIAGMLKRAMKELGAPGGSVELLAARQKLGLRLISLQTQLAAVVFEAECTGELIEAMNYELEDRSDARDLRLALGSLVVGAVSATVAGVWDLKGSESKGPPLFGLVGGLASAALGGAAFIKHPQSMHYEHPRNLLAPVLAGSDPDELFPRFVFQLLVQPAADGGPSPRDRLLAHWEALIDAVVLRADRAAAKDLLYGAGGTYSQELLALRERLYDALETELNAQARDLEMLDRYLVHVLERTRP